MTQNRNLTGRKFGTQVYAPSQEPFLQGMSKGQMLAPHARKRRGSSTIFSKKFGDHVTIDHIVTKDLRDFGIEGEKVALVVKDVFTNSRHVYPSATKAGEAVYESLLHYFKVDDEVGIVYSDKRSRALKMLRRRLGFDTTLRVLMLTKARRWWNVKFGLCLKVLVLTCARQGYRTRCGLWLTTPRDGLESE